MIDFTVINIQELLGKQKEIYRMKPEKLVHLGCEMCKLFYDYSKVCTHYNVDTPSLHQDQLALLMNDPNADKMQMLMRLAQNLDVLSTFKLTSFTLIKNQFADLLLMFISKDGISSIGDKIGDFTTHNCLKCSDSSELKEFNPSIVALKIICRSFACQIECLLTGTTEGFETITDLEKPPGF